MPVCVTQKFYFLRGERVGAEAEHTEGREGPVGDPIGGPCPRRTSLAAGEEDGGMDDGAAVNDKWGGTGCAVMSIFTLPAIWPRAPRPPQILRRLQR